MTRLLTFSFAFTACLACPAAASTLLDGSEKTYARECLDYNADGDALIQMCQNALHEGKFGRAQHVSILKALGDAYRWEDRYDDAESTYREILNIKPVSSEAMVGLGWVAYGRNDYEEAMAFFNDANDINPTNDGLGGYAGAGFRAGLLETDVAVEHLDAALSLKPEDRWTLREKGWVLYDSRRYEAALQPFQAALDLDPEDANAHKGMAKALADLERYDEALDHINTAAELAPENVDTLIWRSHISRWNGHNLRALKDAALVIERRPKASDGYVLKARAESNMGFDKLAIQTLRDASDRFEGNLFVRYWLASILQDDDQPEEAFALMQKSLGHEKADEYDYKLYASLALELGELAKAREAIATGRNLAPWMSELGYLESRLLVLEGAYDRAEAVFEDAVQEGLAPSYSQRLAQLMIKQGEMKRAIALKAKYEP